jgi:hypothetical protein
MLPLPGSLVPGDFGSVATGCAACLCAPPSLELLSWHPALPIPIIIITTDGLDAREHAAMVAKTNPIYYSDIASPASDSEPTDSDDGDFGHTAHSGCDDSHDDYDNYYDDFT